MCMVLSPNCCVVTIFEYSTTEVTLPSCLSVASEHVASQSKWQSADLDLLKLAKKRKDTTQELLLHLQACKTVALNIIYSLIETTFASIELTFGFDHMNSRLKQPSGVSLSFCAGGQWGFSAGHF